MLRNRIDWLGSQVGRIMGAWQKWAAPGRIRCSAPSRAAIAFSTGRGIAGRTFCDGKSMETRAPKRSARRAEGTLRNIRTHASSRGAAASPIRAGTATDTICGCAFSGTQGRRIFFRNEGGTKAVDGPTTDTSSFLKVESGFASTAKSWSSTSGGRYSRTRPFTTRTACVTTTAYQTLRSGFQASQSGRDLATWSSGRGRFCASTDDAK